MVGLMNWSWSEQRKHMLVVELAARAVSKIEAIKGISGKTATAE